jgi:hypothetical protein
MTITPQKARSVQVQREMHYCDEETLDLERLIDNELCDGEREIDISCLLRKDIYSFGMREAIISRLVRQYREMGWKVSRHYDKHISFLELHFKGK